MRVKVYFQMSINLYNAEIEEEKHLITLGHHTVETRVEEPAFIRTWRLKHHFEPLI